MDRKKFFRKDMNKSNAVAINQNTAPRPIIEVKNRLFEIYNIQRNEVTGNIEARKTGTNDKYIPLNENTVYIQLKGEGYRVTMSDLMALMNSDYIPTYNPFQDYFDHLPEPIPDTIDNFANHVKAIDQEQFNLHFKKMLVRVIACSLNYRIFNKQCFTLIGRRQDLKIHLVPIPGTACTWSKYYTEYFTNDKDGQIALTQNLLIGLDELSSLSKFELNQLKASFSRDNVSVRHPWAKKLTTEPRRASFVASTNEDSFLNDTTGSVRWLCFEILDIDWSYRKIAIDKVWSEAYYLYKSGVEYELTGQEIRQNEQRNEQFQLVSPEFEYCQKYFRPGNSADGSRFLTTTEIRDLINEKTERKEI